MANAIRFPGFFWLDARDARVVDLFVGKKVEAPCRSATFPYITGFTHKAASAHSPLTCISAQQSHEPTHHIHSLPSQPLLTMGVHSFIKSSSLLALAATSTTALNIIQSNDDGWAEMYLRTFHSALIDAGYDALVSGPADNESARSTLFLMFSLPFA